MSMANTVTSAMGSGASEAAGSSVRIGRAAAMRDPIAPGIPASPDGYGKHRQERQLDDEMASTKPCDAPMHFIKATVSI